MLSKVVNVPEKQLYAIKIPGVVKYPKLKGKRGIKFFNAVLVIGEISPIEADIECDDGDDETPCIQEADELYPFPSSSMTEEMSEFGWASKLNFDFEYENDDDTIYSGLNLGEIPKNHIIVNLCDDDKPWLAKLSTFEKITSIIDHKCISTLVVNVLQQMGEIDEHGWKFRDMIMEKILSGFEKCGIVFKNREKYLPSYDGDVNYDELL